MKVSKILAVILVIFIGTHLWAQTGDPEKRNDLSLTEQLAFSTVRIEVVSEKGTGTGTGFFFALLEEPDKNVPVIVTNRHVVKGVKQGAFILTSAKADGTPDLKNHIPVRIDNFEQQWLLHPDANIDLAIMPIAPLLNQAAKQGIKPFFKTFNKGLIPTEDQLKELTAVEDILMIGYPNGIWDRANNYPIFRKGITATHPANKYEGRDEFMIDAACFPGSSGSPVFLYNVGNYVSKQGATVIGSRFYFLGVLYGGPQYTIAGKVQIVTIPERQEPVAVVSIPNNLGNVIRSSRILDFEEVLKNILKRDQQKK